MEVLGIVAPVVRWQRADVVENERKVQSLVDEATLGKLICKSILAD